MSFAQKQSVLETNQNEVSGTETLSYYAEGQVAQGTSFRPQIKSEKSDIQYIEKGTPK